MPTITRSASIPLRTAGWSDSITLQQIDPALGITSLALSLTGTIASTVVVTNLDLAPAMFDSTASGLVVLSRPNGSAWLSASPVANTHGVLPSAVNGRAGPVQLTGQGSATTTVGYVPAQTASADAALLVGTGQVALPLAGSARIHATGPGNMTARFTSLIGADVSFTAATGTGGGSGGGYVGVQIGWVPVTGGIIFAGPGGEKSQTRIASDAVIGTASSLTFDGFDPSLGVLASVGFSITADASGTAMLENLGNKEGAATVGQAATVAVTGPGGAVVTSAGVSFSTTQQLATFDGVDDLAGPSSTTIAGSAPIGSALSGSGYVAGMGLAAYRSGPVSLGITRAGSTTLDAPGNLDVSTTLVAGAEVTLTYHYVAPTVRFTDTTTGISGTSSSDIYAGPVAFLQRQYIWSSPDGVALASDAPDTFLHGGAGADALTVSRGSNVLDGGGGSNFLVGGTGWDGGQDTFFLDARGGAVTWSTLVNFHAGDTATVFGFHPGTSTLPWTASDGAAGYRGLTLHSETAGAGTGVDASLTFAGVSQATANAQWSITSGTLSPGTAGATDYLSIHWNG